MRLTLRTLLALLDGILDPADQADLQRQVDSSDYAKDLVHRARDVSGRLRLGAPALDSDAPANDPNLVAEYLDNTLDPERVTEFEKVCLESDEHLAEVVASHHVLTMVLGEPAEVDPELRQKMYRLPDVLASAASAPAPPVAAAMVASLAPAAAKSRSADSNSVEIPDYLRAAQKPLLVRLLPAIAALVVLGTVSYLCFRPNGWLNPTQVAVNEPPTTVTEPVTTPDPVATDATPPEESAAVTGPAATDLAPVVEPPVIDPATTTPIETAATEPPPIALAPLPPPTTPDVMVDPSAAAVTPEPSVTEPATPIPTTPDPAAIASATPSTPPPLMPSDEDSELPTDDENTAEDAASEEPQPSENQPPKPLGMFASAHEMILRTDQAGEWVRLPVRTPVMPGDHLLALPTYRPQIDLSSGVSLDLSDATDLTVNKPGDLSGALEVQFGRVLLTNISAEERKVKLTVGELKAEVALGPQSTLAVEVDREFQAGNDPQLIASPLRAVFAAPEGNVTFKAQDAELFAEEPGSWVLVGDSLGPVEEYTPLDWIAGQPMSAPDTIASPKLELQVDDSDAAWTELLGIFNTSKKKEERALAARCSLYVGRFKPFFDSLRDEEQKLAWEAHILTLRDVMARSPELAKSVEQELVTQRGAAKAADLYEMLRGYSLQEIGATPEERRVGALAKLIDWLESDQLDYRVLANYNLEQITGRRGVFVPAGAERSRETAVAKLRKRLESDDLRPPFAAP
jgi:hypothetical protein